MGNLSIWLKSSGFADFTSPYWWPATIIAVALGGLLARYLPRYFAPEYALPVTILSSTLVSVILFTIGRCYGLF